jgi:hypothetical protein
MRIAASILGGVAAAVMTAIPLAWLGHGLHSGTSWIALLIGAAVSACLLRFLPREAPSGPISPVGWIMILIYACVSARAFLWLIYPAGDEWKILSPNNLGDLSLHLSFIRWLAAAPQWWPASPILAGAPLRYPLGSDLFNALLLRVGLPVETGLVWCGVIGASLAGIALWRWGKGVALAAFLFNDGIGRLVLAKKEGVDPEEILQWKNFFLTLFVTQRGFLFALPAGLLLLSAWREEFFRSGKRIIPLPVQALLLGATPLFSIHAALFLGVAMSGLWLLASGARRVLARLALLSWPPMALCGWLVTSGAGGPSAAGALGLAPGWMSDGSISFWFWNFGIVLPAVILLCGLLARRGSSPEARAFVWPAAAVFGACLVIRFAPWPWDNTKLMLWSWVVIIPCLWEEFLAARPVVIRAIAALLLFGAGAVTLAAGIDGRHGYGLVRRGDLDQADFLLRGVPPGAVIACAPEYNQPVLMLGHPLVCGYEGHLWSHGLDYKGRWDALNAVMNGEPEWREKARALGVSHIFWGEPEKKRWPDSKLPWAKEAGPSLHQVGLGAGK